MITAENRPLEPLRTEIINLNAMLVKRDQRICYLEEQLAWFKRQIFGTRSEKVVSDVNSEQLTFEGFDLPNPTKKEKEVAAHTRRTPTRDGQDRITLSPDLPVETTTLDIPEEKKVC